MSCDEFVLEYTRAKRAFYDIPHIKMPDPESVDYKILSTVAALIDEMGGTYNDFMTCQFKAFRQAKVFPKPEYLLLPQAIERYKVYMINHKIGKHKLYAYTSEEFKVLNTGKVYHMDRVMTPMTKDNIASQALLVASKYMQNGPEMLAEWSVEEIRNLLYDVEYTIAKYAFIDKLVPDRLVVLRDRLEDRLNESN